MASLPEDIQLKKIEVEDESDTTSEEGESVEVSASSPSDDEDGESNKGGSDGSTSPRNDSGASSSDESSAPVPTVNKGKQRADAAPKSILKKNKGKECETNVASSEDWKSSRKTKICAQCERGVQKSFLRRLEAASSNNVEDTLDKNTIHNLEVYLTISPAVVLCDRCAKAASILDQYKGVAVEDGHFAKSPLTNSMSKRYAREVIAREQYLDALEQRRSRKGSKGKSAIANTVSFAKPAHATGGLQSNDAASVMSSVSRVSFGSIPPLVGGQGEVRRRRSFCRVSEAHYEPGRWSWEAVRERGDLEGYVSDSDDSSNAEESSAQGKNQDKSSSRGWLDTSGRTVMYYQFYGTPKTKEDQQEEKREAKKRRAPAWLPPETHIIRRKREGSITGEVKWLVKAWCCCR